MISSNLLGVFLDNNKRFSLLKKLCAIYELDIKPYISLYTDSVKYLNQKRCFINGYRCYICMSRCIKVRDEEYYRFSFNKHELANTDFFIFIFDEGESHCLLVVPVNKINNQKRGAIVYMHFKKNVGRKTVFSIKDIHRYKNNMEPFRIPR